MDSLENRNRNSRRQCLRILGAGVAAMTLPHSMPANAASGIVRKIPKSGELLPVISLGTYDAFDIGSNASDRDAAKEVLKRFVELGGAILDSSPMYGSAFPLA